METGGGMKRFWLVLGLFFAGESIASSKGLTRFLQSKKANRFIARAFGGKLSPALVAQFSLQEKKSILRWRSVSEPWRGRESITGTMLGLGAPGLYDRIVSAKGRNSIVYERRTPSIEALGRDALFRISRHIPNGDRPRTSFELVTNHGDGRSSKIDLLDELTDAELRMLLGNYWKHFYRYDRRGAREWSVYVTIRENNRLIEIRPVDNSRPDYRRIRFKGNEVVGIEVTSEKPEDTFFYINHNL